MTRRDHIDIQGLHVDCVVGVNPEERERDQPISVDLRLTLPLRAAALSADLAETCSYDRVADEVAELLRFRGYGLLERAAEELAAMLLGIHPQLDRVALRIHKPWALRGRARGVSVAIERDRSDLPLRSEVAEFGEVEVLFETDEAGLYLLHISPRREIPLHEHKIMRELEWLVGGEVERDGRRMKGLEPVVWPRGRAHAYRNVGDSRATLFCCDMPRFLRADEIVVARPKPREDRPR